MSGVIAMKALNVEGDGFREVQHLGSYSTGVPKIRAPFWGSLWLKLMRTIALGDILGSP